jgi:hypothetical protein
MLDIPKAIQEAKNKILEQKPLVANGSWSKKADRPIKVAVDMDGTILIHAFPGFGEPIQANVEKLNEMKALGWTIVVFTARLSSPTGQSKEEIAEYLKSKGIPFDDLTAVKPYDASAFLDDRQVGGYIKKDQPWPSDIIRQIKLLVNDKSFQDESNKQNLDGGRTAMISIWNLKQASWDGLSAGMTLDDIANKHDVDITVISQQLAKGVKVEMEHTKDHVTATAIASDHLVEDPYYYDHLAQMETQHKAALLGILRESGHPGLLRIATSVRKGNLSVISAIKQAKDYIGG